MLVQEKGMSDYFSHVIALAIAFIILALIATSVHDYYMELSAESQRAEASSISEDLGKRIMDLYSEYRDSKIIPQEYGGTVLASTEMDVPNKIAGSSYSIKLNSSVEHWIDIDLHPHQDMDVVDSRRPSASVVIEVSGFLQNIYVHNIYNIELELVGQIENPERIKLEYIREGEGEEVTDKIKMTGLES